MRRQRHAVGTVKNRTQALTYEHQACPRCSHPASADEKTCSRCGEALGGRVAHRARRIAGLLWPAGVPVVATIMIAAIVSMYATTLLWGTRVGLSEDAAIPCAAPRAQLPLHARTVRTEQLEDVVEQRHSAR
jgi:predicted nucleic acid-binding Zn ribbon protein